MIRSATPKDAPLLTRVSFASKGYWNYPESYFEIWKDELTITPAYIDTNQVFVYEDSRGPIGYYSLVDLKKDIEISGIPLPKGIWLEHMFILPEQIGNGTGRSLFNHFSRFCIDNRIPEVGILADPNAKGFYEKMGCSYIREYPSTIAGRTTPYLKYLSGC